MLNKESPAFSLRKKKFFLEEGGEVAYLLNQALWRWDSGAG